MSRVNERGWTPIESDARWEDESYYESVKARCDALAHRWSVINHEIEQADFARRAAWEGDYFEPGDYDYPTRRDYPRSMYTSDEEREAAYQADLAAYEAEQKERSDQLKAAREEQNLEMEWCMERLEQLGARLMRPYEHWHEDEAWMEYQERDRDYDR